MFYINNYIDRDQFNQLYNPNQIEKGVQNIDAVACKLGLALTRANNHRLEIAREERQKKEEIKEKQKTEAMVAKCCGNRGRISLSSKKEENYESNIRDDTDPDQANDKYLLQH